LLFFQVQIHSTIIFISLISGSDVKFGLSLGLDKLASTSSIWPQPGLGLVKLALKNVLSDL